MTFSLHPVFEDFSTASVGATVQRHFVTENRKKDLIGIKNWVLL